MPQRQGDHERYQLTPRERRLLNSLHLASIGVRNRFNLPGELKDIVDVGRRSFDTLVHLGLIEAGTATRHNSGVGYRITPDGFRCLYGKTAEQIEADGDKGILTHERPKLMWPI